MLFQCLRFRPLLTLLILASTLGPVLCWTPTYKIETQRGNIYLRPLSEHSVIFSFRPAGSGQAAGQDNSLLWDPGFMSQSATGGEQRTLKLGQALDLDENSQLFTFVNPVSGRLTLEVRYRDGSDSKTKRVSLNVQGGGKSAARVLTIRAPHVDHLFGLGEQFPERDLGQIKADLKGKVRHSGISPTAYLDDPLGVYGNSLTPLAGGNVANALFPVLYLSDVSGTDALLFLDNPIDSQWDFRKAPWTVRLRGGEVSGALAWGKECEELRKDYLTWTGRPPVPPRKAFGLWVSEYGYENWQELEDKAKSLKDHGFPVDGFVLDLQWFGGIVTGSTESKMGRLSFDETKFPNPAQKIADLARRGLGIVVIEESYIASGLAEFQDLASRGFLVRSPDKEQGPHLIDRNPWWGIGSMIDYTNPEAGEYWHQTKREPLAKMGVMGHWTDLGEPEVFRHKTKTRRGKPEYQTPLYHGGRTQLQQNNLFGLSWAQSIFRGYGQDGHTAGPRPFILARTGTSGMQRFGASLWSGDIGSNWESLRSHYVAQSHMALSGIDYFGSDVGGFYREAFQGTRVSFGELYSRWFAAACLTDIPLRPHTMNLGNKYETAPDRVGDRASNLLNLKLRYRLIPYLYSAAHTAWLKGYPVVAPASLDGQAKGQLQTDATVKRLGADLLAYLILEPGSTEKSCRLPSGEWYDFHTGERVSEEVVTRPTVDSNNRYITPLFARAGSVICVGSENVSQSQPGRLELMVFPGDEANQTEVFYDDGSTESYRGGDYATILVEQSPWKGHFGQVFIHPAEGNYADRLPSSGELVLHLASSRGRLQVRVNGQPVEAARNGNFWTLRVPRQLGERTSITFQ